VKEQTEAFISNIKNILINGHRLKNHFDDDVTLTKIYRYLDKLNDTQKDLIQEISIAHTRHILGGQTGVLFYDVACGIGICYQAQFR
jgi:2-polyprenyl-3-methyl-5-hydroxy-6-metoxy-1,4-benzoquinol methylase